MITRRKCINLDITYRCTLQCSKCNREIFRQRGQKVPGHDMSMEEFKKIYDYFDEITFCGQVSDPIFNPNFIDMLKMCHDRKVNIHTAASHKPWDWYMKAFDACKHARWEFGLDGVPEESHKYRVKQDGSKIWDLMCAGREKGLKIVWQYLVFDYNENDIDACRQMAEFKEIMFKTTLSSRFSIEQSLKPKNSDLRLDTHKHKAGQ